jgi:hypothetical protein
MGRMSDLDIQQQEIEDIEQTNYEIDKQYELDKQQAIAENKAIDLDLKQIVIDAQNSMMANAKQMDKQMEEEDAKKT